MSVAYNLRDAEAFLRCFPEANAYCVTVLDREKKPLRHFASIPAGPLRAQLPEILHIGAKGHVFLRPNMFNVVFLDMDSPIPEAVNDAFRLLPRLVTQTSVVNGIRNLQAWYVLDPRSSGPRQATTVTRLLQEALGSDPKSTGEQQQGRLSGSRNCKLSLQPPQMVTIIHQDPVALMSESVFLQVTRGRDAIVECSDGVLSVRRQAPRRTVDKSDSGKDWARVMGFFESNPTATVADAVEKVDWVAIRPDNLSYRTATARKARSKVPAPPPARDVCLSPTTMSRMKQSLGPLMDTAGMEQETACKALSRAIISIAEKLQGGREETAEAPAIAEGGTDEPPAVKLCKRCQQKKTNVEFSATQWRNAEGGEAGCVCQKCVGAGRNDASHRQKSERFCTGCERVLPKTDFSNTQWAKGAADGSKCKVCASAALERATMKATKPNPQQKEACNIARQSPQLFANKEEASRYIMQTAGDCELPSVSPTSLCAINLMRGRTLETCTLEENPKYAPEQKLRLLRTLHEIDFRHAGGHDAIRVGLKQMGESWKYAGDDARFVIRRREQCCRKTGSGCGKPPPGNLPKPAYAGECVGVDLKTVVPDNGSAKWVLLLLVDFTSGKVFCWDLDFQGATLEEVQGRIVGFMTQYDPPLILWSDNGGQFKNVLEVLFLNILYCKCCFIPVGHPASNGLVEVMNGIVASMCAGSRIDLPLAAVAYNNKTKARLGVSPETAWRALQPATSRWVHLAVNREIEKMQSAGAQAPAKDAGALSEFDAYCAKVREWESDGQMEKAVEAFSQEMDPIRRAISSRRDRADIALREKWKRNAPRLQNYAFVSGDRVLVRNSQVSAATSHQSFEPSVYEVTQAMGALLQVRRDGDAHTKVVHHERCKLCPTAPNAACEAIPLGSKGVGAARGQEEGAPASGVEAPEDTRRQSNPLAGGVPAGPDAPTNQIAPMSSDASVPYATAEIDVPPDGGCLFHSLVLELHRIQGQGGLPPAGDDLMRASLELRQAANGANKKAIEATDPAEREVWKQVVIAELEDEPTHKFTSWEAYFNFMDKPNSFATFFSIAGVERHWEGKYGVNVWAREPSGGGYCLQRDARSENFAEGKIAHVLYVGNHYMVLKNPPTEWRLQRGSANLLGPHPRPAESEPKPDCLGSEMSRTGGAKKATRRGNKQPDREKKRAKVRTNQPARNPDQDEAPPNACDWMDRAREQCFKFDDLPSKPDEFHHVSAAVISTAAEEFGVQRNPATGVPRFTVTYTTLTLAGRWKHTCVLKVPDGPRSRHTPWLNLVKDERRSGGTPILRLWVKVVQAGKGAVLRLKPRTTPEIEERSGKWPATRRTKIVIGGKRTR